MKDQLKLSGEDNHLKQTINSLNQQLSKQQQLNRLQAVQLLEFEQSLWQANKQRDEAEKALVEGRSAPTPDGDQNLGHELRVKQIQIRDLQEQVDMYLGKAPVLNTLSRQQLISLNDELQQSQFAVGVLMRN